MTNLENTEQGLIPDDFPRPVYMGAVSGAQPKFLAVLYNGKFYVPGCTPPELLERVTICNDLVERVLVSIKQCAERDAVGPERDRILASYLASLISTHWMSPAESRWIIDRVVKQLNWATPTDAVEPNDRKSL